MGTIKDLAKKLGNKLKQKTIDGLIYIKQLIFNTKWVTITVKDFEGKQHELKFNLYEDPNTVKNLSEAKNQIHQSASSYLNNNLSDLVYKKDGKTIGLDIRDFLGKDTFLPRIPIEKYYTYKYKMQKGLIDLKVLYDKNSYNLLMNERNTNNSNIKEGELTYLTPFDWSTAKITFSKTYRQLKKQSKLNNKNLNLKLNCK